MPMATREEQLAYLRQHYIDNKAAYKEARSRNRNKYKKRNLEFARKYKALCGCANCGIKNPVVLQFHHTGNDKDFNISNVNNRSIKLLKAEIKKCIVLCANCHLVHHHEEQTERIYRGNPKEVVPLP